MNDGMKTRGKGRKSTKPAQVEQQMRELVNYNLDGILVIGMDGIALFANPAACSLLNRPLEAILDQEIGLPLSGEDYTEIEIHRPDGTSRTVEMRAHLIKWAGQPAWLADLRDITERKQAQQALRASEEKMSSIFRAAPTGIGVVRDRVLLDVNERICEMTGYAKEELIGQSARILYPTQEDFDFVGQEKYRQIAEGGTGQVETRWLKKDGAVIDILLASTPLDVEDLSKGVTFTALDITGRKKAADALLESHDRLHTILDSIDADIYVADLNTYELLFMNQHMRKSFGDNLIGLSCWRVFRGESGRCPNCTNDRLVDADNNPTGLIVWEGRNPINGKSYINHDRAIKWTDGRLVHLQIATDITARIQAEEALRQSEDKFKYVFDNSTVAKSITNIDGRLHANHAFCEMVGYSAEELENKPWREITHPDDVELNLREVNEILAGKKETARFVKRYIHKNGGIVWVDLSTSLRRDAEGKPVYFITTALDITERKRAEEQQQLLLNIIERSRDFIGVASVDQRAAAKATKIEDYFLPEDLPFVKETILPTLMREGRWVGEFRFRHFKTGNPINIHYDLFRTENPATGEVINYSTVTRDITDRKQAEEALRQSEERFELAMLAVNDGIWDWDVANNKVYFDPRYYTMAGYKPNEFPSTFDEWSKRVHPDEIEHSMEMINAHLAGQTKVFDIEFRFLRKDGGWMWIRGRGKAVKHDENGKVSRMIGTHTDITDRKKAEEAIRQSERQMKALLTSLDDLVFEFDENGTYLNIWAADESLLVMPKTEMLGRNVLEVMGSEHGTPFDHAIKRSFAGNIPQSIEYPLEVIGGNRWFMARVSPILSPDGSTHTVSVLVRDITERKQIEENVQIQLRRVRALNDIDRAISASLDMRLSLDILLTHTLDQLKVDAASILLLNPSSQTLEYLTGKGFRSKAIRESRVRLGQDLPGRAGLERKTMHVPDIKTEEEKFIRRKLLQEEGFVEYFCVPLIAKGLLKGVLEIFNRARLDPDMEWVNYLETLGGQAAIAVDNAQLFEGMQRSNMDLITAYDATIEGWSRAMDLRDKETEGHTLRVTEGTVKLAKAMGVSQQEITHMRRGALLHDIGKLGVPDHILHKTGELDRIEWAIMRQHPTYAFNMLMSIHYLRPALDIPYCHHEKWDGTGYPRGLKGGEIPLAARIFAIVDVWDALRSDRPYRQGWSIEKIREHLQAESGRHFDPQVADAFLKMIEEDES